MKWYFELIVLSFLSTMWCCKDKNTNPYPTPNPNFVIGELLGERLFTADTIDLLMRDSTGSGHAFVTFQALDSTNDGYEWTIGNDSRKFSSQSHTLNFNDPGILTIKLKVIKNGISDSLAKNLVIKSTKKHRLSGIWKGTFSDNKDSIVNLYILNGQVGSEFQGRIDTSIGWPTGQRGYEYIFGGITKIGFGSESNSICFSRIHLVTNGAVVSDNGFFDQSSYYSKDLIFTFSRDRTLKVEMMKRKSKIDPSWVKSEFYGTKIR